METISPVETPASRTRAARSPSSKSAVTPPGKPWNILPCSVNLHATGAGHQGSGSLGTLTGRRP